VAVASLTAIPARPASAASVHTTSTAPPNVLLLVSDDQAWSTFNATLMPRVYADLVDKGVLFTRGYDESSLCCPSRAELFTGLDQHHTGVDTNSTPLWNPTIVAAAHDRGYRTMLAGKYLNSHPCTDQPVEFDVWYCQGGIKMLDPTVYPAGVQTTASGYTVDVLADQVRNFISSTPTDQPFFAVYAPKSPHFPMDDDRYMDLSVPLYRPPNYDAETRDGTFPYSDYRPPLTDAEKAQTDVNYRAMSRAVRGLDTAVGSILDTLGDRADNTMVVYLSDNGVQYGEHRRASKPDQYEEAVNVPFVVKFPALRPTDQPATSTSLVANIDIAPTVAQLLGVSWVADGTSFLPLLADPTSSIRDALLIEQCEGRQEGCSHTLDYSVLDPVGQYAISHFHAPPFFGVVTPQWKLVDLATGDREVYDLLDDKYELHNRAGDPALASIEASLETTLQALLAPKPVDTMIVSGPPAVSPDRVVRFRYSSRDYQATFRCRLDVDGVPGKWKPCPSMDGQIGPLDDGNYVFEVAGTDSHGGEDTTPATRGFSIVSSGPTASITAAPPTLTRNPALHFSFTSGEPVTECRLARPDEVALWLPCDAAVGVDATVADGEWEFEVRGVSATEATDPPAAAFFTVDTTAPSFAVLPGLGRAVATTSVLFSVKPSEPIAGTLRCSVDGHAAVNCTSGAFSASDLAVGTHTVDVTGTDLAGNTATRSTTFVVDLSAPTLTVLGAPPAETSTAPVFSFGTTEPGQFLCRLNGGPEFGCAGHDFMPGFADADGTYTLSVRASDQAGNMSDSQQFTWTMDTVAPDMTIDGAPIGLTESQYVTLTLESEPDVTVTCSVDGIPGSPCASPVTIGPLVDGSHAFSAFATDGAGNQGPPAAIHFVVDTSGASTTVLSKNADGNPGDGASGPPALSSDGRFVAFATAATDLGGGLVEVDRTTGVATAVATTASLTEKPAVSAGGDAVAYVATDESGTPQVWVYDASGTTLASHDATGAAGLLGSGQPAMSADGGLVAFTSVDPLVDTDTNGLADIYVLDRATGTLAVASSGAVDAADPALSADGHWLTFVERGRVRLTDLQAATTVDITDGSSTAATPTISADGRWLDWTEGGAVVDLDRATDTRTTIAASGHDPSVGGDGRVVAYVSDVAGVAQIIAYDRLESVTRPVSVDALGAYGDGPSHSPAADGDGHAVAFVSSSASLSGVTTDQVLVHDWLPPAPPGAPLDVAAVPGDGVATVTWSPPADGGGVVRYDIVAQPGGNSVSVAPTATAANVPSLTNGMATTFTVTAVGGAGSATSLPSNPVTPLSALSVGDATVTESDAGTARATLHVSLSRPSTEAVDVQWQTAPGSASTADFQTAAGTLTIPAGSATGRFDVRVKGDAAKEMPEQFTVSLTATGATVVDDSATVTIVDNDPDPTVTPRGATVLEGSSGTTPLRIRVTLSAPSYLPVSVKMTTVSGSATRALDFSGQKVLTFAPGVTAQTFTVTIVGDTLVEGDETFTVVPTSPPNGLAGAPALVTIIDDDT
jgi:arylsulfatase A-like enzyme/Tol biopolymer transport system component